MASLPAEFNNFKGSKPQVFSVSGAGKVDLDVACNVAIVQGSNNKITVEIDAEPGDMTNFQVTQRGNEISVEQNGVSGGVAISSASVAFSSRGGTSGSSSFSVSSVSGGSSVSISTTGGRVVVNGREINQGNVHSASTKIPRILIKAPAKGDLSAKVCGAFVLASTVPHHEAHLDLSGQTSAVISAHSLDIEISGQCDVQVSVGGGKLSVDSSGQCEVRARGEFEHVKVDLSGAGSIKTEGVVRGNYTAKAGGVSKIVHHGKVCGRVHKETSGMASIDIG